MQHLSAHSFMFVFVVFFGLISFSGKDPGWGLFGSAGILGVIAFIYWIYWLVVDVKEHF